MDEAGKKVLDCMTELMEFEISKYAFKELVRRQEANMDFFDPLWRLRLQRDAQQVSTVFPFHAQPDFCDCL